MPKDTKIVARKSSKSEPLISSGFMADLEEINEAESRKEYQLLLSEIIWQVPKFNHDELGYLSNLIKSPPKFRSGPKFKTARDIEILEEYFVHKEGETIKLRKVIISEIMEKYGLTHENAAKLYNKLRPKTATKKGNNSD